MREKDADEFVAIGRYGDLPIREGDILIADEDGYEYPVNRELYDTFLAMVPEKETLETSKKGEP